MPGMRRVLLDLLAQACDVLVQRPCCSLVLHSPHFVQDREAVQRLPLAGGEQAKQASSRWLTSNSRSPLCPFMVRGSTRTLANSIRPVITFRA